MIGGVHEYRLLILEKHLDTFGHVNNASYLEILEEARWDLITRNSWPRTGRCAATRCSRSASLTWRLAV